MESILFLIVNILDNMYKKDTLKINFRIYVCANFYKKIQKNT